MLVYQTWGCTELNSPRKVSTQKHTHLKVRAKDSIKITKISKLHEALRVWLRYLIHEKLILKQAVLTETVLYTGARITYLEQQGMSGD